MQNKYREIYPTTRWSLIAELQSDKSSRKQQVLDELVGAYYDAFHAHLSACPNLRADQVEDVLHGFVTDKILTGSLLNDADASRGRLRCLLVASLNNYVKDFLRKQKQHSSLAASDLPSETADAALSFDVAWATQVFRHAITTMQQRCTASGTQQWEVFQARILDPLFNSTPPSSYAILVDRLNLDSPQAAFNALANAKRRWMTILREVIADGVSGEVSFEEELQDLSDILIHTSQAMGFATPQHVATNVGNKPSELDAHQASGLALQSLNIKNAEGEWRTKDKHELLRYQLQLSPSDLLIQFLSVEDTESLLTEALDFHSVIAVLESPDASIKLLNGLKSVFRLFAEDSQNQRQPIVAIPVYLAFIVAGLRNSGEIHSRMSSQQLQIRLSEVAQFDWIDERLRAVLSSVPLKKHATEVPPTELLPGP